MAKNKIVIKIGKNKASIESDRINLKNLNLARIMITDAIRKLEIENAKRILTNVDKMNEEILKGK